MHHNFLLNRDRKRKKLIKSSIVVSCLVVCAILIKVGLSYYVTSGNFNGSATVTVLGFSPKVNNSTNISQTIDLSSTITNNKNLAPGAQGKFKVDIDFSNVESDVNYKIYFDRSNIPSNIHFYVDEDYTDELTTIDGVQLKDYNDKIAEHNIYWSWNYVNTPESNANDQLYMNKNITLPFVTEINQKITKRTIIVNGYERPTGKVYLNGTQGYFNLQIDFSNVSPINYKIYFNKKELSNNIHLYSDSSYTNEINNILDYYDGINKITTKTIYWKSDSTISNDLYYIVEIQ